MNIVNSLLPSREDLCAILRNPENKDLLIKTNKFKAPLSNKYYKIGCRAHRLLPWSVNWVIASIAKTLFPTLGKAYLTNLGMQLVGASHSVYLSECEKRINSIVLANLSPMKKHPNVTAAMVGPKQCVYIKSDTLCPRAKGLMELLVWDCAQILELDDYFTPTILFSDLGCLQPEIKGRSLEELLNCNYVDPIKEQIITATMAALFLGLSDANAHNIFLDKDDHIHFIDNSRCFPHSNNFIKFGNELATSFRCGLIECYDFYSSIDSDDRNLLLVLFARFKTAMPRIIQAIEKAGIEFARLDFEHKDSWFNKEQILQALYERVDRMEKAIRYVDSLRDLLFAVHPGYRIAAALTLAEINPDCPAVCEKNQLMSNYIKVDADNRDLARIYLQTKIFWSISGCDFSFKEILLGPCLVDLTELQQRCCNSDIPFDDIIDWIASSQKAAVNTDEGIETLWRKMIGNAKIDLKT